MKYPTQTNTIKILMIKNGLTVNKAATRMDMDPCQLSTMIHGRQAYFRYRPRLAELLGVAVKDIFPDSPGRAS